MSKILLINPPIREFARPNDAPLGLLYIASYLEQHGHDVDVCDLNAYRQLSKEPTKYFSNYSGYYDVIGLSGLITTYEWQKQILEYLSERGNYGKLVLGGGMATFAPEFVMHNYPEVDIIVTDEGEQALLEIVEGDKWNVNGTYSKREDDNWNWFRKTSLIPDLDTLPFPNYDKVPVEEVYIPSAIWGRATGNSSGINYDMKRSLNMIMSRGCKYSCKFCAHAFQVPGCRYRMRSVENVISEIDELVDKYNIDFIGFVDDNMCDDDKWIERFCNELLERPYELHWGGSARVDEVSSELLKLMHKAGCEWLGYGIESINTQILRNMNKGHYKQYKQLAEDAIRWTKEAGIWCNCTFIIGYPGETIESIKETAQFMHDNDVRNNMFYATAYPGTKLYDEYEYLILDEYGTQDEYIKALGDATEFRVNFTDMSNLQLMYARGYAIAGKTEKIGTEGPFTVVPELDPLLNTELFAQTYENIGVT